MLFSALSARRILFLLKNNQLFRSWQILLFLMMFFLLGYLAAFGLVAAGFTDIVVALTGVVFFFGALFVFIVVRLGYSTISDQQKATAEVERLNTSLEDRVKKRTEDLERRLRQIRTGSDIARQITSSLDPQTILNQVVNLLQGTYNLYYVGAFLLDKAEENAVLHAGTGEPGLLMINQHHHLPINSNSMVGWSIRNRQPRIASDVGKDPVRFNNPFLPLTRSEIALPLMSRNRILGALSLQSSQPEAFDEDDIFALQGVTDVLAAALDNAHLYQLSEANLKEIRELHRSYLQEAWAETVQSSGDHSFSVENLTGPDPANPLAQIELPLVLREQTIGQITLETDRSSLSAEEIALIDSITTQTALALENARLLEETQRRASREQLVGEVSSRFSRSINVEEILKVAVEELGKLPAVSEASIFLKPPDQFIPPSSANLSDPAGQKADPGLSPTEKERYGGTRA